MKTQFISRIRLPVVYVLTITFCLVTSVPGLSAYAETVYYTGAYRELTKDAEGEDVIAMQSRLIELGFLSGVANGIYGDQTEKVISAFQDSVSIEPSGIATVKTLKLLYDASNQKDILSEHSKTDISGTIVALAVFLLTLYEATIKKLGRVSENTGELYAKYRYVIQQLELGVTSILQFNKRRQYLSNTARKAYAHAHMLPESIIADIYDFEELSVSLLDKSKAKMAWDFGRRAMSLVNMINSYYQNLILDVNISYSNIQKDMKRTLEIITGKKAERNFNGKKFRIDLQKYYRSCEKRIKAFYWSFLIIVIIAFFIYLYFITC